MFIVLFVPVCCQSNRLRKRQGIAPAQAVHCLVAAEPEGGSFMNGLGIIKVFPRATAPGFDEVIYDLPHRSVISSSRTEIPGAAEAFRIFPQAHPQPEIT